MIILIEQYNSTLYREMLDEMFQLRARVFSERLKWDVVVENGMERDRYDDQAPTYLVYLDDDTRAVRGSLRLLPTTGPTLLEEFFADSIPDSTNIISPTIWECTRFCLDNSLFGKTRNNDLLVASSELIVGLGEVALRSGIQAILGNFDAAILRLYRKLGCEIELLGMTRKYGGTVFLGSFPVSGDIVRRLRARQKAIVASRWKNRSNLAA
jgi:acyl homoserine lactone synthase